jgi:hypothetical protein
MAKLFRITYMCPEREELITVDKEFEDGTDITALEWAEDWAYSMADKGYYSVEEFT